MTTARTRWDEMSTRPVRIANCSGANRDPGYQMYRQAAGGEVDFITGDYLAEFNLATHAEKLATGDHDGWEPTALDGIEKTLDILDEKRIKLIINGGALNPGGLAKKCQQLITEKGYSLRVAYLVGDNLTTKIQDTIRTSAALPDHLDSVNDRVTLAKDVRALLDNVQDKAVVTANAYLGPRGIIQGLRLGADIIICGRVADASPVIAAAWFWHNWKDTDYNNLAGALIAGHLIECSAYVTGSNFAGFTEYPLDMLLDLPFGIAEISSDGTTVITKHENTRGLVNEDTVTCQFLYELQGNVYLNSDVAANIQDIKIQQVGKNRVRLSNITGAPPPPTTKWPSSTAGKWKLFESQIRYGLKERGLEDKFQLLDFQVIGTPAINPRTQFESTTYCRVFMQADNPAPIYGLLNVWGDFGMQHFSGFHRSRDLRTTMPRSYLAYYPALYPQDLLAEGVVILNQDGSEGTRAKAGHPPTFQKLGPRESYETTSPVDLSTFGPTRKAALGDIVLARSGDKGANINIGLFVQDPRHYTWLQSFLTCQRMQLLMGDDWRDEFWIERVEFPNILAVHFVIYGPLGRGVSSCPLLDAFGKGFADYIRAKVVEVPEIILGDMGSIRRQRISAL
ncbi:hypothetical protein BDV12DRAFT_203747 [Aspergillus spectabilis]